MTTEITPLERTEFADTGFSDLKIRAILYARSLAEIVDPVKREKAIYNALWRANRDGFEKGKMSLHDVPDFGEIEND